MALQLVGKIIITLKMIKPVRCDKCKYFVENKKYKGEGICNKDNEYTREYRVCNKLPTDEDRRNAKIN